MVNNRERGCKLLGTFIFLKMEINGKKYYISKIFKKDSQREIGIKGQTKCSLFFQLPSLLQSY